LKKRGHPSNGSVLRGGGLIHVVALFFDHCLAVQFIGSVKTVVVHSVAPAILLKQGVNEIGALHDLHGYEISGLMV
jgi:hypothetical protein